MYKIWRMGDDARWARLQRAAGLDGGPTELPPVDVCVCPYNRDHRMPRSAWAAHVQRCERRLRGLPARAPRPDPPVPSSQPFYSHAPGVVTCLWRTAAAAADADPKGANTVLFMGELPAAPDLPPWAPVPGAAAATEAALYEHVRAACRQVEATRRPPPPAAVTPQQEHALYLIRKARVERERGGGKSEAEVLAAADARVRRPSRRARVVRTVRHTPTEAFRRIIAGYASDVAELNRHVAEDALRRAQHVT